MSVVLHSLNTDWVKRIGAGLPVITVTTGGLMMSLPLCYITWALVDDRFPETIPGNALASIV